ncbi:hypothetical protein Ami103574_07140 [Aminipila butyrica]|uniref:Uncharacterized protein n=1 Tax=Aminipila butyrica TaxID=433296 RepID=A0A858BV97_9FIRM|nr:hypothetical protein [Aminipila butyrica]QIB69109.1 hypothetical protein Ami103574_07140 [Aminipila butyrica]
MKKRKNLYLVIALITMILSVNMAIPNETEALDSKIPQEHIKQVEASFTQLVNNTDQYMDRSLQEKSLHISRFISIAIVLVLAYLFCIHLAVKNHLFLVQTKKKKQTESTYSLQGVNQ